MIVGYAYSIKLSEGESVVFGFMLKARGTHVIPADIGWR